MGGGGGNPTYSCSSSVVGKQTRFVLNGYSVMDIGAPTEYLNSTIYQGVSLVMRAT